MIITTQDKLDCAERELTYRRRVYDRLVANKKMTRDFADRQIDLMAAIAEDYRTQVQGERLL